MNKFVKFIFKIMIAITIIAFILLITAALSMKCVKTETYVDQVKIVDEHYEGFSATPKVFGNTIMIDSSPAKYQITVIYKNKKIVIDNSDIYHKYKNSVGEFVNATIEEKQYDNGAVKYNIMDLE